MTHNLIYITKTWFINGRTKSHTQHMLLSPWQCGMRHHAAISHSAESA